LIHSSVVRSSLFAAAFLLVPLNKQCYAQVSLPESNASRYVSVVPVSDVPAILKIDELRPEKAVEENIGEFCFPPILLEKSSEVTSSTDPLKGLQNPSSNVNSDQHPATATPSSPSTDPSSPLPQPPKDDPRFHIGKAILQSFYFTALMNAWRISVEPSTRKDLKGKFWPEYVKSVESLRGWRDGDEFIVNYIGHPMQGAVSGYLQIQNDGRSRDLQISTNPEYWKSRLRALGWAALLSCQFELGPFSEASIGNVGLKPDPKSAHPMAYVDLVVTPTIGTAWLIGEDLIDRYILLNFENRVSNRYLRALARTFLTPSRSFANLFRAQKFWYRDNRSL
jgi:hypothetical protein